MDGNLFPQRGAHFFDVLECQCLLEFLRDLHIANKNEEYERKWSNDLRLQAHHDHHAPRYDMDDADYKRDPRSIVLSVLQTLNSLNKFSHAWTKPVLGYSLTFHPNQWLLLPSKLPERDLYRGEFDLLRSFTRVYSRWMPTLTGGLRFVATVFPWPLQEWQGSIRILRFGLIGEGSESTFRAVLEYVPGLEELARVSRTRFFRISYKSFQRNLVSFVCTLPCVSSG